MTNPTFPHGLRVFLRTAMPDGSLHFTDLPTAKDYSIEPTLNLLKLFDEKLVFVGIFPLEAVSMLLPLAKPQTPEVPA